MDISECCADNGASGCKTTVACAPGHQCAPQGRLVTKDRNCTINDPNGPIYDPVHGVYHLHYQNHVGLHGGRTWGHAVSKDLSHWAHLPISIWNDQPYDSTTIASGSGTMVNGKIIQVYPGICNTTVTLCIAVPADPSDPLQTNWSKTWVKNPIPGGMGFCRGRPALGSGVAIRKVHVLVAWTSRLGTPLGLRQAFPMADIPLPKTSPGATVTPSDPKPTHVHKISHRGDHMRVGT